MAKTTKEAKEAKSAAKKALTGKGKKHLVVLMDESGSMNHLQEAVVTGCNDLLHDFRKDKSVLVTLAWFDAHPGEDRTRFKVKAKPIKDVEKLAITDYNPRGMTPLNDAVVDTITAIEKKAGKDDTVFIAILTDGHENASETSAQEVAKLVEKYEGKKGWGFVYLGANQQAEVAAAAIGLRGAGKAFNFNATKGGVKTTSSTVSSLASSRFSRGAGALANDEYAVAAAAPLYAQTGGKLEDDDEDEQNS